MNFTYDEYRKTLAEDAHAVEHAVETIRRTVRLRGPRAVQAEIAALAPRQPVDRGTYKRSWRVDDVPGGAAMYNFAPHASVIELGRRPGRFPPIDKLAEWVRRKRIGMQSGPVGVSANKRGLVVVRRAPRLTDAAVRGLAFVIARQIARRGLPARHIMLLASRVIDRYVREALSAEKAA